MIIPQQLKQLNTLIFVIFVIIIISLLLILQSYQNPQMLKLSTLANNIQKQGRPISNTIIGVVTDITRPLYRQKQNNYIVMLKIIDQSLNDQQLFGVMSKDCTVYLISKDKKQINFIKAIGQIILLDKFTFSLWNDIKLQTKYLYTTEGIYTVSLDNNLSKIVIRDMLAMNRQLLDINNSIIQRIKYLMQWRSTYLSKIYQPKLGISILNSHCVMVQPFNMILRYQNKIIQLQSISTSQQQQSTLLSSNNNNTNNNILYTLILKDINNNIYRIKHYQDILQYQQGDLIFIRGINSIGQNLQLHLTQTGNILRFTYHINQNIMNYMGIYRDNQKFISIQKENQFTIIQCQHNQVSYIAELIQLEDKYNHSNRKDQLNLKDIYFIKVVVINYQGILSMYHRQYQILLHDQYYTNLSQQQQKQYKQLNRIGYVYQGVLGIIDRSNQSKCKPFYVYLFTSDNSGKFIEIGEFQKAEKAIGNVQQDQARGVLLNVINKKLKKISTQSNFQCCVALALQPIKSERLLFRVVNTKII